jgi:beta-glucosidase
VLRPGDNSVLPTTDGLDNLRTQLNLTAGQHTLTVAIKADVSGDPVQARLNWVTPAQQQANTHASVAAARHAKTAVVFAWSTGSLDTLLPDGQDQLIAAVAAANPDTIVVLNNSDPVAMPWLGSVKAVLDMWYPGDTGGYATANVLLGAADPAGRLPFTWPASLGQGVASQPATHPERTSNGVDANGKFCTTPGSPFGGPQCTTTYTEGIYVGYRWYDQQHETPLYPFGYGLSYTRFAYSGLHWAAARDGGLDVAFRVTNTGSVAGDEVPHLPGRAGQRPRGRSLRGPGPGGLRPDHPAPGPVPDRVAARAAAPAPVLGHPGRTLGDGGRSAAALCRRQRAGHRARRHRHHPRRRAVTHRKPR